MITYVGAHWQNGSTDALGCAVDRYRRFQKLGYEEWNSPPFQQVSSMVNLQAPLRNAK